MRLTILAASAALSGVFMAAAAADFESPPDESPAASLAPAPVAGENFLVEDPVHSDGLMHHYLLQTRFGVFAAYGRTALTTRLREVAALTTIAKTSDADVVFKAVGRGIQEDAKSVVQVARNPVGTVLGIPKGIGHLFGGVHARAEEVTQQGKQTLHGSDSPEAGLPGTASRIASQTEHSAKRYADRYLGLSAAERRWYAKLGIDPYTNNEVLQKAVKRLARIDAAAGLGMRFAPIGIPMAGEIRRALDTIYNEDPAVLRKRRREALATYGLTPPEIEHFENTLLLSPTRQTLLVEAVKSLDGVEGRAEILRHATSVTTEEEIEVFLQSTRILVRYHARQPLARIVSGLRVPTAQLPDGRVVVFGSFDAVYWTKEVAAYEQAVHTLLPDDAPGHEVWLDGAVSPLARARLEKLGWSVHHADELPALPQPPESHKT